MENKFEDVKILVRSLLTSSKTPLSVEQLQRDYGDLEGDNLPFKSLGFNSVIQLLQKMDDVLILPSNPNNLSIVSLVDNDKTRHLRELIAKQKLNTKRNQVISSSKTRYGNYTNNRTFLGNRFYENKSNLTRKNNTNYDNESQNFGNTHRWTTPIINNHKNQQLNNSKQNNVCYPGYVAKGFRSFIEKYLTQGQRNKPCIMDTIDLQNSIMQKVEKKLLNNDYAQLMSAPNNFRELTVYPTLSDLEFSEPFLQPIILKGAYRNVEHYLDVHFRLLREDFLAPLREGIALYKEISNDEPPYRCKQKINNLRIYYDVEFEKKDEFLLEKNGFLINFDKTLNINYYMENQFKTGSLLIFSADRLKNIFLGIALQFLDNGMLLVELLNDSKPLYNTSFTMFESEVFFEPYRSSMEVLKNMNTYNFPMKKYIISACKEIDYLVYIDTDQCYSVDNVAKFRVLFDEEWPKKEELGLDEMQLKAFKAALTREFTVIQGPPGTGKTFIGLKIVKTIINSYEIQGSETVKTCPIIVVCYTNHALDQFLDGILSFTKKVVRIGSSQSEIIEKYNIKKIRNKKQSYKTDTKWFEKKCILDKIKYFELHSRILSLNSGIVELSLLKNGMPKIYHRFFNTSLDLITWLFQDIDYFTVNPIEFITAFCYEMNNGVFHSDKLLEIEKEDYNKDTLSKCYMSCINKDIIVYSITLDDINGACKSLNLELEKLANSGVSCYYDIEETNLNFDIMEKVRDYFTSMSNLADADIKLPTTIQELNVLDMRQRWKLYLSWVNIIKEMFDIKIMHYEQIRTHLHKQFVELRDIDNIEILKKMHVVGLTTTGAAKKKLMFEALKPSIVVVEEAAEVLEPYVISSLTSHCQHLILIGDHKQLRPSNSVYKLAKHYNFNVSLMERMVNNNLPCYTLALQYRMRPEIASLLTPSIYYELKNHKSVECLEHVRGITKDLFFLNHKMYETEVDENSSKSNRHEATFLIEFARHLILQGYKTNQVTIITTYNDQVFELSCLQAKHSLLNGLKITTVDNYQGEECDIILLSLVRSNRRGNIGFLKTENRICVALSRAKYGLYIMGNMENLYNSGNLWKQLKEKLIKMESYGDELALECSVHPGIITKVSKGNDFSMVSEGGCNFDCKSLLSCGHYCLSICHSYDRDHKESKKCRQPCNKSCDNNHPCMKECYIDCEKCTVSMVKELPCSHKLTLPCFVDPITFPCEEKVEVVLEDCGHKNVKICYVEQPNCTFKCLDWLDCGHACELNCHKNDDPYHEKYECKSPCEKNNLTCPFKHKCQKLCHEDCFKCTVKIDKTLPCGHMIKDVLCSDQNIKCLSQCDRLLMCQHQCTAKCFEKCQPCKIQVDKVIPDCGHSVTIECSTEPTQKHCTQMCDRILSCGHKCMIKCAEKCSNKKCEEIVLQKKSLLDCGHENIWVLCCDINTEFKLNDEYLLNKCLEPCLIKLMCGHICMGTCGQCQQGLLHIPCNEICNKINPCGHKCELLCKERCPPCSQKCIYSCNHSKCTLTCGQPCVPCVEKCIWECSHLKCSKKCGEICDRNPCYMPCEEKLQCGHMCIGFCGEPCPPICCICQSDEVTTKVIGNKDEQDARFVLLEDCKHIVESKYLEQWMNKTNEIMLKTCPVCKMSILRTRRFMNQVKMTLKDVSCIQMKQYKELSAIKRLAMTTLNSLSHSDDVYYLNLIGDENKYSHNFSDEDLWGLFFPDSALSNDKNIDGNFSLPLKNIESLNFVFDLFKCILKYKSRIVTLDMSFQYIVTYRITRFLSYAFTYARQLSNQQMFDINKEMARSARIIYLFEILSNSEFKRIESSKLEIKRYIGYMETALNAQREYNSDCDEKVRILFDLFQKKIKTISVITDEEESIIQRAVSNSFQSGNATHGSWFKCWYNHIYCITEDDESMFGIDFCPECNLNIGGHKTRVKWVIKKGFMEMTSSMNVW